MNNTYSLNKFLEFDRVLLEAVDEGLMVLGGGVRQVIYYHLEHKCYLCKEDIPNKLEAFVDALERIFLPPGAKVIEKLVTRKLYGKLGLSFEEAGHHSFKDYVEKARRRVGEIN